MKLDLISFAGILCRDVEAEEIFFEKFQGDKTIWISSYKSDDVLVVVEANGATRLFPFAPNIQELKNKKLDYKLD